MRLLKRLPITVRSPRPQTSVSVVSLLRSGKRAAACGVPALLFWVAIANPCEAVQVSGYASPPPTPITQVPNRDLATATTQASTSEPTRYAPPVHVTPPSPSERSNQTPRIANAIFNGESVNGRRNTTQQVSYSGRPAVAKLSDHSLAASAPAPRPAPAQVQAVETVREIATQDNSANRFVGLHEFKNEPTPAVQPRRQERIRRPGLQDHISAALKRTSGSSKAEPTEAVRYEEYAAVADAQTIETTTFEQPARQGSARASGSYKRQRVAGNRNSRNVRPERFDEYDELLVRQDDSLDATRIERQLKVRDQTRDWENDESAFGDDSLEPVEFATDYQRPTRASGLDDQIDEEIMPTARVAAVQSLNRLRTPRVSQSARPLSRQYSQSTRGQQISILSRSRQESGGEAENDFEEVPNRLRANRQIEKIDDFDPLNDDRDDDSLGRDDDLDDLDRDIDAELKRMRERSDDDESDEDDDDSVAKPLAKDCDTFRNELLGSSIRDIALDISPPASSLPGSTYPIGRSWTDQSGNVIATGAMQDLRRGYVILDNGQKIAYARLSESDLAAVSEFWGLPTICSVGNRGSVQRNWIPQTFTWTASNLCHKTLFFENVQLERYGHSHGPFTQPVQSVAHFFVSLVTVPYQAAIHPANECQYALGYYRPGNCAPWLKDPIPISLDGARRQALAVTGLSLIP